MESSLFQLNRSESARGLSRLGGVPLEEDDNAQKRERDKGVAHFAPTPLPKSSDSGKPTWRQITLIGREKPKDGQKEFG